MSRLLGKLSKLGMVDWGQTLAVQDVRKMVQTAVHTGSKAYQAVQTGSRPTRWFKLQNKLGPGLPDGSNCSTNWVKGLPDGSNCSTNCVPAYQMVQTAVQTRSRPTRWFKLQYKLGQRPTWWFKLQYKLGQRPTRWFKLGQRLTRQYKLGPGLSGSTNWVPAYQAVQTGSKTYPFVGPFIMKRYITMFHHFMW